ncbi:MAG: hypothetical protein DRJ40_09330 [Thermoprotei archaeon]|nr:MAG: hypothetical protein DRJ40_09330 [Thermoprotei archaeon]
MRIEVEKGKWIKVIGPANIKVVEGLIEVWGKQLGERESISIPRSRATIILALEKSVLEVKVGEGGSLEREPEVRAPVEWKYAIERITTRLSSGRILVLGNVASGKSTFSLLLLNTLTAMDKKCAIIDTDLGQSDFGLPSVISMSIVSRPYPSLSLLPFVDGYFVGCVSPAGLTHKVVLGVQKLLNRALSSGVDFTVVVTDGWIRGWEAREQKLSLIDVVRPDVVIALELGTELEPILKPIEKYEFIDIIRVPALRGVPQRDAVERKMFRENMYKRHFRNARVLSLDLGEVNFQNTVLGSGFTIARSSSEYGKLANALGIEPVYVERAEDTMLVVLPRGKAVDKNYVKECAKQVFPDVEEVVVVREGDERGLLCGLYSSDGSFLGLGILQEINFRKGEVKVLTPAKKRVSTIHVGRIRLDEYFNEKDKYPPNTLIL